ncbi:glycosyltransferase family 2 protein [Parahaliea mediterranea]|uniref:Glycosyltransferase n=1 Tax=Parahaliea mediterranea TaxID=651086 RepID=A0A939DF31_9GAMM|nr:glycosyltransferase family 2 protein [Parahaliea mediterranea]MBN7796948.1 glycosyltransferase [Parahaliea mediterranea]
MAVPTRPVGSVSQRAIFVVLQCAILAGLLWITATLLGMLLPRFVAPATVTVLIATICGFQVLFQGLHLFRTLAMRRAVIDGMPSPEGLRIAMATTIVPSREFSLLEQKLAAMAAVSSNGCMLDHWVLDEEDDPRVRKLVAEFNQRYRDSGTRFFHFTRHGVARYNEAPKGRHFRTFQARQKGGNINAWLDATRSSRYDLVTFIDLDHFPEPDFYRAVLPCFGDPDVAFVQGPEVFRNREENFITRAASHERDTFFGLLHRSYFGLGMPVIVGAHTTFRRTALDALGGYYPVHLTEDYLIMLRLRALGLRGIYIDTVIAVGELPSTWNAFLGQQRRWASGGLDLLFRYFPKQWRHYSNKERLFGFMLLNYYIWGTFFVLGKTLLLLMLLVGVTLEIGPVMLAGLVAFILAALMGNHLWERQFFIQPERRTHLVENAVMNLFLGPLYCLSLFRALIAPNTPFEVTAKNRGEQQAGGRFSFRWQCTALLCVEALLFILAWLVSGGATEGKVNLVQVPLLLSLFGTLYVLANYRRHEASPAGHGQGTSADDNAKAQVLHNEFYPPSEPERGLL